MTSGNNENDPSKLPAEGAREVEDAPDQTPPGEELEDGRDSNETGGASQKREVMVDATALRRREMAILAKASGMQLSTVGVRAERQARQKALQKGGNIISNPTNTAAATTNTVVRGLRRTAEELEAKRSATSRRSAEDGEDLEAQETQEGEEDEEGFTMDLNQNVLPDDDLSNHLQNSSPPSPGYPDVATTEPRSSSSFVSPEVPPTEPPTDPSLQRDHDLVEATPVAPTHLAHADAVDLEQLEREAKAKKQKEHRLVCFLFAAGLVMIVGIVLGVVLAPRKSSNSKDTGKEEANPTKPSVILGSVVTNTTPTHLEYLLETLPAYTLVSLQNPFSHQTKAYDWLETHRHISTMEEWRKKQLFALACFYFAADGPNWPLGFGTDWMDDATPECDWFSSNFGGYNDEGNYDQNLESSICNEKGEYTILMLSGVRDAMPGLFVLDQVSMPPELALLTALQVYDLSNHDSYNTLLMDMLPYQMTQLTNLEWIRLGSNNLLGTVPSYLGQFSNLKYLYLFDNSLSGTIPSTIFQLKHLEVLDLWKASLRGQIPSELGLMSNLKSLHLGRNEGLTGTIPPNFFSKDFVALGINQLPLLTGPVPFDRIMEAFMAGNATGMPRGALYISGSTSLSGTVPKELCLLNDPSCFYELNYSHTEMAQYYVEVFPCVFYFDCTELLCGCNCTCN